MDHNYPTLNISYLPLNHISLLNDLIQSIEIQEMLSVSEHYVLMRKKDSSVLNMIQDQIVNLTIHELLLDDIINTPLTCIQEPYNDLTQEYDEEVLNLFILKDSKKIETKLYHSINFTMKEFFKTDILQIEFTRYPYSSIPKVIYNVLKDNFHIKKHNKMNNPNIIIIKRRISDNE